MATAHTAAQPGLQAGSWAPDADLMKQFVVEIKTAEDGLWIAIASFHTKAEAVLDRADRLADGSAFSGRLWDNFRNRQLGATWLR